MDVRVTSDGHPRDGAGNQPTYTNQPNPPTPLSGGEVEVSSPTPKIPAAFEAFWEAYPRKKSRNAALKAWLKVKSHKDAIMAAIEVQKGWHDWTKEGGSFIPYPATWLNAGGWMDKPKAAPQAAQLVVKANRYPDKPWGPEFSAAWRNTEQETLGYLLGRNAHHGGPCDVEEGYRRYDTDGLDAAMAYYLETRPGRHSNAG